MTTPLYLKDAYQTRAEGSVTGITQQGGIILDQSLFYATSGGQPGDCGTLSWDDQDIEITTTIKGEGGIHCSYPRRGGHVPRGWASDHTGYKLGYAVRAYAHAYGIAFIVGRDPIARYRWGHHSHQGAFGFRHARGTR